MLPWLLTLLSLVALLSVAALLSLAGCAERPLTLPATSSASTPGGADLAVAAAGDLGVRGADDLAHLTRADLAGGADLAHASDLANAPDLTTPVDLASARADLALVGCTDRGCGGTCDRPCDVGQACRIGSDCKSGACDAVSFTCVADRCHDHRRDGLESDIDCGDGICAPCGTGKTCTSDGNCYAQACDAITFTCAAWSCGDHKQDSDETDVDCGGLGCATLTGSCAPGQKCATNFDCRVGSLCTNGRCLQIPCGDGVQDNGESDVDCGGYACGGCAPGQKCVYASDCLSKTCDPATHRCTGSLCRDGVRDGDETDIDCGGSCAPCAIGKGCKLPGDCVSGGCDASTLRCVAGPCIDRRRDGDESDVDCGGSCGGCALGATCAAAGDCDSGRCDAATGRCVAARCGDGVLDGNETAIDCGGSCAPCPLGAACGVDQDCASKACDAQSHTCVADQCGDHHRDAAESDVDCGGGACARCVLGQRCNMDSDCVTSTCDEATSLCHVAWCQDGVHDWNETDVDCGGGQCPGCAIGQQCYADYDCASRACDAVTLRCVADACSDHHIDGDETDIDCGGTTCAARCALGRRCVGTSDCGAGLACWPGYPHVCQ